MPFRAPVCSPDKRLGPGMINHPAVVMSVRIFKVKYPPLAAGGAVN
jgi:hypothetical protein